MDFFSEYRNVQKLLRSHVTVLFYAENRYYYPYLKDLIEETISNSLPVVYITSDRHDPLIANPPSGMQVYFIRSMLAFVFTRLKADIVVMTMPDLGNYIFRKSPTVKKYIYVFHAAVSTHQQYGKRSFDNYDIIFCAGQYHEKEIRASENLYQLPGKQLVHFGYPLFNSIKQQFDQKKRPVDQPTRILIAPSWYDSCIFNTCLEELIGSLVSLPYEILIRSHPEYVKRKAKKWKELQKLMSRYGNISIDRNENVIDSIVSCDVLITDRSGIAFEFAFGTLRPVLFIDTPLKVMNTSWHELQMEPVENRIRQQLGLSLAPTEINNIKDALDVLLKSQSIYPARFENTKKELFYDNAEGMKEGINCILTYAGK